MYRSRRRNSTRVATMIAAAALALGAAATSTQANESELTGGTWPSFSEPARDVRAPGITVTKIAVPGEDKPVVVSAPLPPAVATGAFVLGGQWVMSLLWKKRRI